MLCWLQVCTFCTSSAIEIYMRLLLLILFDFHPFAALVVPVYLDAVTIVIGAIRSRLRKVMGKVVEQVSWTWRRYSVGRIGFAAVVANCQGLPLQSSFGCCSAQALPTALFVICIDEIRLCAYNGTSRSHTRYSMTAMPSSSLLYR